MNINKRIIQIDNLHKFDNFVNNLEAKEVGILGRRFFVSKDKKNNGKISLNAIVLKFYKLNQTNPDEKKLLNIRNKISELDDKANKKLRKKNWFIRNLMHFIFGSKQIMPFKTAFWDRRLWRRHALQEIGYRLTTSQYQNEYLVKELFDELKTKVEGETNGVKTSDLKKSIVMFVNNQSKENATSLMENVNTFINRNKKDRSRDEKFLIRLLYSYRLILKQGNLASSTIREELCSMLLAAYANAKNFDTNFNDPENKINSVVLYLSIKNVADCIVNQQNKPGCITVYPDYTGNWKLNIDKNLLSNAQTIVQQQKDQKENWWKLQTQNPVER